MLASLLALFAGTQAEACRASWYSQGRFTASGARFNPNGLSAAMRSHNFGVRYRVTFRGRSVVVKHDDYGPAAWTGRCIDLSAGAARAVGLIGPGVGDVRIARLP